MFLLNYRLSSPINGLLICAVVVICNAVDVLRTAGHHSLPLLADLYSGQTKDPTQIDGQYAGTILRSQPAIDCGYRHRIRKR